MRAGKRKVSGGMISVRGDELMEERRIYVKDEMTQRKNYFKGRRKMGYEVKVGRLLFSGYKLLDNPDDR